MLSAAKHLEADGILDLCLRLMLIDEPNRATLGSPLQWTIVSRFTIVKRETID
jgi:hypothetical protein